MHQIARLRRRANWRIIHTRKNISRDLLFSIYRGKAHLREKGTAAIISEVAYRTGSLWTRKNTVAGCVMTVRFPIPLGMLTKMRARKDPSISGIMAHYPTPALRLLKERSTFCLIRNWDYQSSECHDIFQFPLKCIYTEPQYHEPRTRNF